MRTMASVWLFVTVVLALNEALGNVCNQENNEFSCDECIRCGGSWCNELGSIHCVFTLKDDWCPDHQEILDDVQQLSNPGDLIDPIYAERTLFINVPDTLDVHYTARNVEKARIDIVNSTRTFKSSDYLVLKENTKCSGVNCTTNIEAMPTTDFCSASGKPEEFVYVTVTVGGLSESIVLKYRIPCACKCTQIVDKQSSYCNKQGDFSCGICTCYDGWMGETCSKPACEDKRGDVQCTNPLNDLECSGNGYCGPCDNCICYKDREGSQYFDRENYCADLCMVVNDCEFCLANNTVGRCDSCIFNNNHNMYMNRYNSSLVDERDGRDRKVWVKCNETIDGCLVQYVAKKDEEGDIIVMVVESCNDILTAGQVAAPKVPIIVGVVGLIAAVAAVAGIMIWKHMNALPPPPLNNPGYENIDAEDCTGENPLYKPPTSSFKNPMYGNKW